MTTNSSEQSAAPGQVLRQPPGALNALAMVAGTLGLRVSAEKLQRDHGRDGRELTLAQLARVADRLGLRARRVRLTWKHLVGLGNAFPAILRFDDGTVAVAERIGEEKGVPVVLLRHPGNPDGKAIPVDELRLSRAWSGEAMLLKRRAVLGDADKPFGFGWMLGEMARERALFRDVAVAASVMSLLTLVPPLFYMLIIDRVLVHQRLSTLTVLAIGIAVILVFDTILGSIRRAMVATAAAKIDARVNLHMFDRLLNLPIDFFDKNATGVIAHKLGEARRVRLFLTGQLFGALLDGMTLFVLIPAMFILNAQLAFFVLAIAAMMALVVLAYMGPIQRAYGRVVETEHGKTQMLIETLHGIRTVKSLALEGRKRQDWDGRVAASARAATALQHLANQPQTLLAPLEKLIYSGSLCLGAYIAITADDPIFAGTLVAFTMIATRATQPIVQMAGMLQQFQEARGALAEVASVVNVAPETRRENGVRPAMRGAISFEDVRFSYPGSASPALDGIRVVIEPNTVVGVMGRSGSGKTTITRLLQGLHQSYQGLIKIDGIDLREIDLDHLRARTGVVLQDSFLFQGTIRENILIGRPDAPPAAMIEAARLAGAEEFIERLPRGYETMIEEHASNLSGGQRQRLAIARALVTDPPILIFDEATSALDPDSEAIINANLRRIAKGRTVIVISHRLASLVDCDQILVLETGRLKDAGRHAELLQRCEVYRHLWVQQNRHLTMGAEHEPATARAVPGG
ncbi:MAG: peptidase domain-containing ABC transporter [Labrys sp. (in: a-proteobacteria)]